MRRSLPDDERAVVTRFRALRRNNEMPTHMHALLGAILGACLLVNWVTILRSGW
jgi:hypothetical protein